MFSKEKHLSCSQNILEFNLQEPKVPNQIIVEQFYIESVLHLLKKRSLNLLEK